MIGSALYRQPVLLDSTLHRTKRLAPLADFSIARHLHAVALTAAEFPQASLDLPIIFVPTGERLANGRAMVSPAALLGLSAAENLCLDGARWDARYLPAFIRRYPFLTAPLAGSGSPGVFVDAAWSGFSDEAGEPLFADDGARTPALERALGFLREFDEEARKTRVFCERLVEHDLLEDMQADATLPGGQTLKVDGFLTLNARRFADLPDEVVLDWHRNGMLMLLHAHQVSLANVRRLVERKVNRISKER